MNPIPERLALLRKQMVEHNIAATIIPSNDPHFSEYVADRWKCREWISGFTGSAGTAVVTLDKAALWTDSRYFIQAEEQLKGSGFELKKMRMPGTEAAEEWLIRHLPSTSTVGIDGGLFSVAEFNRLQKSLLPLSLTLIPDLFTSIWAGRPSIPSMPAFLLGNDIAGESVSSKLKRVREALAAKSDFIYPISMLDEIAWLFNLRGSDIDYNPLAVSYATVSQSMATLYISQGKLSSDDKKRLEAEGVTIHDYSALEQTTKAHKKGEVCLYNARKTAIKLYDTLEKAGFSMVEEADANGVVCSLKSIKNKVEQSGFRNAMVDDGVALVRFQRWLENNIANENITELSAADTLRKFREQSKGFVGESFGAIMGYREHGAIVHYSATKESDVRILPEGFLLFDTGGQYRYGTTDVTRTIHLATPSSEEKDSYTRVLKGMIALSMAKFPEGTRGSQLDVLARQALWAKGKNYLHGTGHGVGHFLNVHEGPQSIRMEENPVVYKPGMVTSNEPAIYVEGKYGIRIENLILCIPAEENGYLEFETLTLAPIDVKPIDKSLLTHSEVNWLNSYHQLVFERLAPMLSNDEQQWLKEKTKAV